MPSPFPGMHPWLERPGVWEKFHVNFLTRCQVHLLRQVRPNYQVRIVDIEKQRYLNVVDRDKNDLVAAIELLSPSNKYAGPDREQYRQKRRERLRSRTHLVELDLLRGGPRMDFENMPHCDYCAVVSRVEDRPEVGVWPWQLRDAMPSVPVPLRGSDPDAVLDLKSILDQVYDETGLADRIYAGPPEPRLAPDGLAWAEAARSGAAD